MKLLDDRSHLFSFCPHWGRYLRLRLRPYFQTNRAARTVSCPRTQRGHHNAHGETTCLKAISSDHHRSGAMIASNRIALMFLSDRARQCDADSLMASPNAAAGLRSEWMVAN
jgi:hypothetical protein